MLPIEKQKSYPYHFFEKTPQANQLILDLAQECITTYLDKQPQSHLLLWVCLSSLDLVGHSYGPGRLEIIDMLYHLDQQIKNFIKDIQKIVPPQETLFTLTSDHGCSPLIESVHHQGINFAQRIDQQQFINRINTYVKKNYNLNNLVQALQLPNLYLDQTLLNSLPPETQTKLIADLKNFLRQQTGVKQVWTFDELYNSYFSANQIENYFKNQLFLGRSGSMIMQMYPYVYVTPYTNGADHLSPYNYDTHVPLIFYQQEKFEQKKIIEKVWSLQLANSLAQILAIPKPSASTFGVLPKLFE
jgi:Type I phosphodiesterase / nucleotide pyrophosphatase